MGKIKKFCWIKKHLRKTVGELAQAIGFVKALEDERRAENKRKTVRNERLWFRKNHDFQIKIAAFAFTFFTLAGKP